MFKLKGHSGCKLELHESNDTGKSFVRKLSKNKQYNSRLKAQSIKQSTFKSTKSIFTPAVINSSFSGDKQYFDMEYVGGDDFVTFTCGCRRASLDGIAEIIFSFLQDNIDNCRWIDFPLEKYKAKVEDTLSAVKKQGKLEDHLAHRIRRFLLDGKFSNKFPSGYCHGDLTFSNVIVIEHDLKIALIDFLDQGFESPIHDIVKIRQDTKYYWTLNLYSSSVDSTKIKIAWAHIDRLLKDRFFENQDVMYYYSKLQVLNFLRILKYTEEKSMDKFVIDCMIDAMEETKK